MAGPEKHEVNRPCVVCGGGESAEIHRLRYLEFGYPGDFVLRECAGCGLVFHSPRLGPADLAALYDGNYYVFLRSPGSEFGRVPEMVDRTLGLLPDPGTPRRLVEVGCGKGYVLAAMADLGWDVEGVELAADAAAFARDRMGLAARASTLEAAVAGDLRPADVVLAMDVVEHVPDPPGFLAAAAAAVRPGGYLVLDTPNARSRYRAAEGGAWPGFNPFHIFLFDRDTLGALVRGAGLEVVAARTYCQPGARVRGPRWTDRAGRALVGALPFGRRAYGAWLRWKAGRGPTLAAARAAAGAAIGAAPDPTRTDLDGGDAGDNLVLVARRPTAAG